MMDNFVYSVNTVLIQKYDYVTSIDILYYIVSSLQPQRYCNHHMKMYTFTIFFHFCACDFDCFIKGQSIYKGCTLLSN